MRLFHIYVAFLIFVTPLEVTLGLIPLLYVVIRHMPMSRPKKEGLELWIRYAITS